MGFLEARVVTFGQRNPFNKWPVEVLQRLFECPKNPATGVEATKLGVYDFCKMKGKLTDNFIECFLTRQEQASFAQAEDFLQCEIHSRPHIFEGKTLLSYFGRTNSEAAPNFTEKVIASKITVS